MLLCFVLSFLIGLSRTTSWDLDRDKGETGDLRQDMAEASSGKGRKGVPQTRGNWYAWSGGSQGQRGRLLWSGAP